MSKSVGVDRKKRPDNFGSVEPVIIPEGEHSIRVQDLDREALKVLYRLRDAGFSGYLVGGGVRDLYLGRKPKDFDISTDARPGQLRKLFRNSRTIGRRFRLVQVFFRGGKIIEVSTLRSRSEYDMAEGEKVLPSNNTFGTLPEDALRRDLTINSLFYEIENRTIIDYVGGIRDLDQGIVRIVGDPDVRVTRDPVRMLRAVRHAARSGFRIERETWQAIISNRDKLNLCPASRIRDELLKDLHGGASRPWACLALDSGIFFTLFPCYLELFGNTPGGAARRELLLGLLGTVDRLQARIDDSFLLDIPDYMLLAVLALPWIDARFDLLEHRLKGASLYAYSRDIRAALSDVFAERFNLRRMTLESMTTLLVNLPVFAGHGGTKGWPSWLRKKSYFRDCLRFYQLFEEARGGGRADDNLFRSRQNTSEEPLRRSGVNGGAKNRSRGRRGMQPAFTSKKNGVFGLRGM